VSSKKVCVYMYMCGQDETYQTHEVVKGMCGNCMVSFCKVFGSVNFCNSNWSFGTFFEF
jgi:hypothetical protein